MPIITRDLLVSRSVDLQLAGAGDLRATGLKIFMSMDFSERCKFGPEHQIHYPGGGPSFEVCHHGSTPHLESSISPKTQWQRRCHIIIADHPNTRSPKDSS